MTCQRYPRDGNSFDVRLPLAGAAYAYFSTLAVLLAVAVVALLYTATAVQPPDPLSRVFTLLCLVVVCWTIGLGPVAFADLLTLAGAPPRTAWIASAHLAWSHRRAAS